MRFASRETGGFRVFAVTGINTVSFGITSKKSARDGLLGFAVERFDPTKNERYLMPGFKVFRDLIPHPTSDTRVSTWEHPVQSFVWDDFTADQDHVYEYAFYPIRGRPRNLDRSGAPVKVRVKTEPLFSSNVHDVFFNRGVASSQAYVRKFDNKRPDELKPAWRREAALEWLSRKLDDAILRFIDAAKKGDALRGCFYEFRYEPVLEALKRAIKRGVDVKVIVDMKINEHYEKGVFKESFPKLQNRAAIAKVGLPSSAIIARDNRRRNIQHNKFIVLLKGGQRRATQVWTGSTNLSVGGFHGQTNVGHWIRDAAVAKSYFEYWTLLSGDPGAEADDGASLARRKNAEFYAKVAEISPAPASVDHIEWGITPLFSPRTTLDVLNLYANLLDSSHTCSCITFAFNVNDAFKRLLKDNTSDDHITFVLLESKDVPNKRSTKPFININASNNVYKAWGSYLDDPVYQWARETSTRSLQLNQHVAYIHSKFMISDPLGDDPIVVTGSANFSEASTNDNDENMVIIRGDQRVADIYFTEFNRLFNHYYFRAVQEATEGKDRTTNKQFSLFLGATDSWLAKYRPGTLRAKRVDLFAKMKGISPPP